MTMTREELQRLYDDCQDGRYGHLVALVDGVRRFLGEPDPTVEIAYLKAALADVEADVVELNRQIDAAEGEVTKRSTPDHQERRPPMSHDDIRAALEAATRQPWVLLYPGQCCEGYCIESEDGRDAVAHGLEGSVSDLDLITSAPTWLAELLAEVDEAQAEAMYVSHDYDRRGERLWRLAALAGWTPGNEADNDATAELCVRERLAEVDALTEDARSFAEAERDASDEVSSRTTGDQ